MLDLQFQLERDHRLSAREFGLVNATRHRGDTSVGEEPGAGVEGEPERRRWSPGSPTCCSSSSASDRSASEGLQCANPAKLSLTGYTLML